MIIYQDIKSEFMKEMERDALPSILEKTIYEKMNRTSSKNEIRAWENSLQYMYKVLNDYDIPNDSGVAIEYNVPLTAKRIDFILSGFAKNKERSALVIELKQWEKVELVEKSDGIVETFVGGSLQRVVHPSYQAWSYCAMIEDYNSNVEEKNIAMYPCAYLHNYRLRKNDALTNPMYKQYLDLAPVFTRGDIEALRGFIKKYIRFGDKCETLYLIDKGILRPSKSLQDSLASMIKGNREFTMIDEQKVVFEQAIALSSQSKFDGKKRVYIVKGGPGTGKSVVAVNLLVNLTRKKQVCQFVSKNSAPRNVYAAKLTGTLKKSNINNLFRNSGSYLNTSSSFFDTLLVDEAHRLNEKSGLFGNLGENQIKEIIRASKCSIFFIDERQRIHIKDIGTIEEIKKWAKLENAQVFENELVSQFRCNGSDGYLGFVDHALQIRETANYNLEGVDYDFQVLDSPHILRDKIFELNKLDNRARILAGYCWLWPKEEKKNPDYYDIKIGDFEMSWNLDSTDTYAIDPDSVNQVGCIHTSQGLEFDYVGVIIGEDLRYENDEVITDYTKRASTDHSIKGLKTMMKNNPARAKDLADQIIRNTYRTLMTRGMKGCYIYCVDKELGQYFKKMLGDVKRNG